MTLQVQAEQMVDTVLIKVACTPASSRCKFEYGNGSLSGSYTKLEPNGANYFEHEVALPANSTNYLVKASVFDDEETQDWVESPVWQFPTTPNSRFAGGGKTL